LRRTGPPALLESLIRVCEEEGNFPIGYRMARGADRFFRQGSALAHTAPGRRAPRFGLGGLDWSWALVHRRPTEAVARSGAGRPRMVHRAQLQSSPRARALRVGRAVWASALPCRKNRSARGHPVADREVALFLADPDQDSSRPAARSGAIAISSGILRLVDVPHRATSNANGPDAGQNGLSLSPSTLDQRV